jgi:hypothetical protein
MVLHIAPGFVPRDGIFLLDEAGMAQYVEQGGGSVEELRRVFLEKYATDGREADRQANGYAPPRPKRHEKTAARIVSDGRSRAGWCC